MAVRESLTKSEIQYIRQRTVQPIFEEFVGAMAFPSIPTGPGAQEVGYDVATEISAAEVIAKGGNFPRTKLAETRTTLALPKIGTGFSLPREDVLSSRITGSPINARWMVQAGKVIARKLDDVYFNGIADMGIQGMVDAAGNTTAGTAVWSGGTATPFDDVNDALALIEADKVTGKKILFLDPTNRAEMRAMDANSHRYDSLVLGNTVEGDDALVSAIRTSSAIAHGTGLVATVGEDIGQRYVAETLKNESDYSTKNQAFEWNVWAREVPVIYEVNGYCTITGI
jgi:uncharacterized linocin/CFP29 family protein